MLSSTRSSLLGSTIRVCGFVSVFVVLVVCLFAVFSLLLLLFCCEKRNFGSTACFTARPLYFPHIHNGEDQGP